VTDGLFAHPGDDPLAISIAGDAAPLADRMRPRRLEDVIGQEHLTGPRGPFMRMVSKPQSFILWGPPGTGKTTLAQLLADFFDLRYVKISAIDTGVADLKRIFSDAIASMRATARPTFLFVDEIHRFNKGQQDAFLPHMESGVIVLVGATTENPSFELNAAINSRATTYQLRALDHEALDTILGNAEEAVSPLPVTEEARNALISDCGGDARYLLGQAEMLMLEKTDEPLTLAQVSELVQRRLASHDKAADGHYDLASAFQKSVRGSDPHAALYWGARMFIAGDVAMLIRRMTVTASEEVGMADPSALLAVIAAGEAHRRLGDKEGWPVLAQAIVHVSVAPKSNASYSAAGEALAFAHATANVKPPKRIMNAPTKLMKDQGYKEGYVYDHDAPRAFSGQDFWPDDLQPQTFYRPTDRGQEPRIAERLDHWDSVREQNRRKTRD
jgi:putative ATPase